MGSVTGYTAEKMDEIVSDNIIDGNVVGDNLILLTRGGAEIDAGNVRGATGATGPTGDVPEAPEDGEFYLRKDGDWRLATPNKSFVVASAVTTFTVTTTSGQDWHPAAPLDLTFTKKGSATESNILVHLGWSGHLNAEAWCTSYAGVLLSGVDHWTPVGHQCNLISHFEFHDKLWLTGLSAGLKTLRARIKLATGGSQPMECDLGDFFSIEYEEVYA